MFSTPVLFLIFNRPEHTQKTFSELRKLRPRQLFIAADGPREGRPDDLETTAKCRDIVTNIDWECELKTLFRDENLGCGAAPAQAINWFFDQVEAGIILEDDVLTDQSFFIFCEKMLERYKEDERVMHISGCYFLDQFTSSPTSSYYFTKHIHVWGWASWNRAWKHYDYEMKMYRPYRSAKLLKRYFGKYYTFWEDIFNMMVTRGLDAWDYQWMYAICKKNGLAINPAANLTYNIGFDNQATHTLNAESIFTTVHLSTLKNIVAPDAIVDDEKRDGLYYKHFMNFDLKRSQSALWRSKRWLRKLQARFRHS